MRDLTSDEHFFEKILLAERALAGEAVVAGLKQFVSVPRFHKVDCMQAATYPLLIAHHRLRDRRDPFFRLFQASWHLLAQNHWLRLQVPSAMQVV